MQAFHANRMGTLALTANGVSQSAALPQGGGTLLWVQNAGPNIGFCEITTDANTPAAIPGAVQGGGFPVFANMPAFPVRIRAGDTNIAFISAGNSTLYVTRGGTI